MNSSVYNIVISVIAILITVYFVRGILKDSRDNYNKLNEHKKHS
jgi:hypothetical protein